MNWSEILMGLSTIFWCQAMPLRLLVIYAVCVVLTAIGKFTWEVLL